MDRSANGSGIAAGVLALPASVLIGVSHAGLAFTGTSHALFAMGIILALVGGGVIAFTTALRSSYPGTIAITAPPAALALGQLVSSLSADVHARAGEPAVTATVLVGIMLATLATGACFLLLGHYRLGGLVRFIPYPVVGGVLAGVGWLQVQAGTMLVTGLPATLESLPRLTSPAILARLASAATLAAVLVAISRRYHWRARPLVLTLVLVGSLVLFYAALLLPGMSLARLQAAGWLLGPFPEEVRWLPAAYAALAGRVDWGALAGQAPNFAALIIIAAVSVLIYASGIELAAGRDLDFDEELRAAGLGNLVSGALGAMPGFHHVGLSLLGRQLGEPQRTDGAVAAAPAQASLESNSEARLSLSESTRHSQM